MTHSSKTDTNIALDKNIMTIQKAHRLIQPLVSIPLNKFNSKQITLKQALDEITTSLHNLVDELYRDTNSIDIDPE